MFESFANPMRPLALVFVTPNLIIQGSVRSHVRRLTDLLREADSELLVVENATFMEVGSRRVVGDAAVGQVSLADVLIVHTTSSTEGTEELRTSKQPIKVTLLAPPFTIEGQVHLGYEPDLAVAMDSLSDRWLPVTAARYWAYGVAEEPVQVDFMVVNHMRAHVVVPRGTKWSAVGVGESEPNPW